MFDFEKTPTSIQWKNWSQKKRDSLVKDFLSKKKIKNLSLEKTFENGNIVFNIEESIPVKVRSNYLINLEMEIKNEIDNSITVWCSAQGDKSKLRNLRGVEIKT
jgi:hypothetical protein